MTIEMAMSMMSDEAVAQFEEEMEMTLEEYLTMINSDPVLRLMADIIFQALLRGE
jgi:hypothetical protein